MNGDFLDRLVARARGEIPALRPVTRPGAPDQWALAEPLDRPPRQATQVEPAGPVTADTTAATSENPAAAHAEAASPEAAVRLDPPGRGVLPTPFPLPPEVHTESPARRPPPIARESAVQQRRSTVPAKLPAQAPRSSTEALPITEAQAQPFPEPRSVTEARPARKARSVTEAPYSVRESPAPEPGGLPTGSEPLSDPVSAPSPIHAPYDVRGREIRPRSPQSPSPRKPATSPPIQRPQSPPASRPAQAQQPPQGTGRTRRPRPRPAVTLDDYLREREARRG